jgi:hypothetical protein
MNASTQLGLTLGVLLATGGAFIACGSDSGGGDDNGNGGGTGDTAGGTTLTVRPAAAAQGYFNGKDLYSAFDGEHTFQVPVTVEGLTGATFTADESKVSIQKTADGILLTTKGAGDVTITAKAAGATGTTTLHITQATSAEWAAGEARYNNGMDALPGLGGDGGVPNLGDGGVPNLSNINPAMFINANGQCPTCHGDTAKLFKVQHTPTQTAGYSDAELVTLFTTGTKPAGAPQRSGIPATFWGMGHKWQATEAEQKGLVVYLRSLPPKTQVGFEFPMIPAGVGRRDGGATTTTTTTDAATGTSTTSTDAGTTTSTATDSGAADAGAPVSAGG